MLLMTVIFSMAKLEDKLQYHLGRRQNRHVLAIKSVNIWSFDPDANRFSGGDQC